jgi:hypothetical protein
MAVDTRSKRASSVGIGLPFVLAPVLPDGTIAQADRQHIALSYSGILATALAVFEYLFTGTVYVNLSPTANTLAQLSPSSSVVSQPSPSGSVLTE